MEHHPNYYAVIPAAVRYDGTLNGNAKVLYAEITSLTNKEGFCWAKNEYFAKLYAVSSRNISRWITELSKGGHITVEVKSGDRKIWITKVQEHFILERDGGHLPVGDPLLKPEKKKKETKTDGVVINEVMELFRNVNPSINRLFARNDQRQALDELLAAHGREKIEVIIKFLPKSNGHKYAPKITSPVDLAEKFGKLIAWAESEKQGAKGKGKQIMI